MKDRIRRYFFALIFLFLQLSALAEVLPDRPYYYVLDETRTLTPRVQRVIETLLVEHDRLTEEQVFLVVFDHTRNMDLKDLTQKAFSDWKVGQRIQNKGVLLGLLWKERKAHMEIGLDLSSILTDEKSDEILSRILNSHAEDLDHALVRGSYRILETLNSPLIVSGKATQILKDSGIDGFLIYNYTAQTTQKWWIALLILGVCSLGGVLYLILSREAYFSSEGWFRRSILKDVTRRKRSKKNRRKLGGNSGSW